VIFYSYVSLQEGSILVAHMKIGPFWGQVPSYNLDCKSTNG